MMQYICRQILCTYNLGYMVYEYAHVCVYAYMYKYMHAYVYMMYVHVFSWKISF